MPHSEDGSQFGELLRGLRIGAGLSQEELARRSGLAERTIARLEQGHSQSPHPESARHLADALKLSDAGRANFMACAGRRRRTPGEIGRDQSDRLADQNAEPGAMEAAPSAPGDHSSPGAGSGWPVPRQLPPGVPHFIGRKAELDVLTSLPDALGGSDGAGTVVISAIGGTAGVGKTALAVNWARRAAPRFPDGQLYLNLRGFGPSAPVPPAEAVSGFLTALGMPPERWPAGFDAQVGLYQSLAAGRRLLIVLDNARDADQVRPLLPGSSGCLVLVTSRASLAGLAVSHGAHLLTLDVLSENEARQLLVRRIGGERATAEPGAVRELIGLCAGLPLALAIVAARARARPGFTLADLAAELRDESGRLDALDAGDPVSSVRAVISWSYQCLSQPAARMFRVLGLHPGPDVTGQAAASAAGEPLPAARRCLRELTQASLLSEPVPGRFGFHDLLRAYAAERARATDAHQDRREITGRLLDHYHHTACTAVGWLSPLHDDPIVLAAPRPGVTPEKLSGSAQAMAWFEAEHQVLLAAVAVAAENGFDVHAWQIPWAMCAFLYRRGHWQQWAACQRTAVAAATRADDPAGQALSRLLLGQACTALGDYDQARTHLGHCLDLYRELGDHIGEAKIHKALGYVAGRQSRYADGLGHTEQALRLFQANSHQVGQAESLNNAGWFYSQLGNYAQARAFCQRSISLSSEIGHRECEADAWHSLGWAEHLLGNLAQAIACYQRALSIVRDSGGAQATKFLEATILTHLADSRDAAGELRQARLARQQALDILEQLDHHPDADKVRGKLQSPARP
jgi:tetratricopeptide (TPR) repeat protein/transcriptional regulator with XRE-family HTH domain